MNVSEEERAATLSEIERGFRAHAECPPVFDSVAGRAAALKRLADKYPYVAEAFATGGFSAGADNLVLEERLVEAQLEESLALLGRWYRHLWS